MTEHRSAPASGPLWDASQYARFSLERSRPFYDLLARMPEGEFGRIADLGCGNGELTRKLLERWPSAEVWGIDGSQEMLSSAPTRSAAPNLHFVHQDLQDWRPSSPLDLIVSNAALQWLPDHAGLLERLTRLLGPAGVLAAQMPNNRGEAAYQFIDDIAAESPWADRLQQIRHRPVVESASFYGDRLLAQGFDVQVWETIYYHRLAAAREIVEWLKGATLRPLISALSETEVSEFLTALSSRVVQAYGSDPHGVIFPFRRLFFVARRLAG